MSFTVFEMVLIVVLKRLDCPVRTEIATLY